MQCNYCRLKAIKERARKSGKVVTLIRDTHNGIFPGGRRVCVHPNSVTVVQRQRNDQYFVSWFAKVPKSCRC